MTEPYPPAENPADGDRQAPPTRATRRRRRCPCPPAPGASGPASFSSTPGPGGATYGGMPGSPFAQGSRRTRRPPQVRHRWVRRPSASRRWVSPGGPPPMGQPPLGQPPAGQPAGGQVPPPPASGQARASASVPLPGSPPPSYGNPPAPAAASYAPATFGSAPAGYSGAPAASRPAAPVRRAGRRHVRPATGRQPGGWFRRWPAAGNHLRRPGRSGVRLRARWLRAAPAGVCPGAGFGPGGHVRPGRLRVRRR